jgi:hypothetical protein
MTPELKDRFDHEIKSNKVVLYMKGTADFPRCGFSAAALEALSRFGRVYTVDVLADPEVRGGSCKTSSRDARAEPLTAAAARARRAGEDDHAQLYAWKGAKWTYRSSLIGCRRCITFD